MSYSYIDVTTTKPDGTTVTTRYDVVTEYSISNGVLHFKGKKSGDTDSKTFDIGFGVGVSVACKA